MSSFLSHRIAITAAIGVGAFVGVAAALVVLFQGRLVYYPDRVIRETPAAIGLRFLDIHFLTSDGVRLDGWYVPATESAAIVIVCHGDAGNISTRLPLIRGLHAIGLSTFIFDYRGYGESAGTPTERGTYLDADAAWRWVEMHIRGVSEGRLPIIIMGRSLGGPIAARLASRHPPAALILDSTFPSIRSLVRARAPLLPARLLLRFKYDTVAWLGQVSCPVLVVASRDDTIVPIAQGRSLFASVRGPKEFLELSGPHVGGFAVDAERYERVLHRFLAEYVFGRSAPRPSRDETHARAPRSVVTVYQTRYTVPASEPADRIAVASEAARGAWIRGCTSSMSTTR